MYMEVIMLTLNHLVKALSAFQTIHDPSVHDVATSEPATAIQVIGPMVNLNLNNALHYPAAYLCVP